MQQLIANQANAHIPVNENFATLNWATVYGHDPYGSSGLNRGYIGIGTSRGNNSVGVEQFETEARWGGFDVDGVIHTFGASTTTYVCVDLSDGTLNFDTDNTNYLDSTNFAKVETVITGASSVTSVVDDRGGPGGVWGGAGGGAGGDMVLADIQTVTGAKTFGEAGNVGKLKIAGTTSGAATLDAPAVAGSIVVTLPSATGTLALVGDITTAINAVIASAPGALDTLDELAAALGDDANFASTVTTALAGKAPLASPALTGTPTVPTAAPGTSTTQAASTAFVAAAVTAGASPFTGGTLTSALNEAPTVTIASSTTPAIGAAAGNTISITGTTTITGFDTIAAGARRLLVFAGALTLTHNATSLILPGAANITTAAGDTAELVSLGSGNWRCVTYSKASGAAVAGGAGGLTNFTESVNSSTPNASWPVVSLTATNAATNVDFALVRKGTGGLLLSIPDNTSTGGNKRGNYAIDLQWLRGANTQVASGDYAIVIGRNNTANAADTGIAIGYNCTASGNYSFACGISATASGLGSICFGGQSGMSATSAGATCIGGFGGTASGGYSTKIGGNSLVASGSQSVAIGGESNTASATASVCLGGQNNFANGAHSIAHGYQAHTRGMYACMAHGVPNINAAEDVQSHRMVLGKYTTNGTTAAMVADGGAASAANQMVLTNNSARTIRGTVTARNRSNNDTAGWTFAVVIKRGANAAATALVGSATVTQIGVDAGATAWTLAFAADTTNGALQVNVTGAAATNVQWTCEMTSSYVG